MDSIGDDATGRIESELDVDGLDSIGDLQRALGDRFEDFTPKQKRGFAEKIYEKQQTALQTDRTILDKMTTMSGRGFDLKRHPMVRDMETGRYIGARRNIVITTRAGTRIMVRNTKTGKVGRVR